MTTNASPAPQPIVCLLCALPAALHAGLTCAEAADALRYAAIRDARLRALMLREAGVDETVEDEGRTA